MMWVWNAYTSEARTGRIQIAMQSYVSYNNGRLIFEVISRCEKGYTIKSLRACYTAGDHDVALEDVGGRVVAPEMFRTGIWLMGLYSIFIFDDYCPVLSVINNSSSIPSKSETLEIERQ